MIEKKEKMGIKYDNDLLRQGLLETLPVINADMLFRSPLFSEDYNNGLETTARSLKTTLIAELKDPKKLILKGTSMLGEIVGDMNIDIDYSKKGLVKEVIKKVGEGIKNATVSQKGGAAAAQGVKNWANYYHMLQRYKDKWINLAKYPEKGTTLLKFLERLESDDSITDTPPPPPSLISNLLDADQSKNDNAKIQLTGHLKEY